MKLRLVALAAPVAVAVVACSMPERMGMGGKEKAMMMPPADATALWNHLTKEDFQKNWKLWPGKGKLYTGGAPHGALLTTYVNDTAHKALTSGTGPMPVGSIIVKENYMPDKTLAATTVMYKTPSFDPQNNNWYWLKRNADGKVDAAGKVAGCIACHAPSKRDYLLTALPMTR